MLTGDKLETAVSISQSTSLFPVAAELLFLTGHSATDIQRELENAHARISDPQASTIMFGLVIEGDSLELIIISPEIQSMFVKVSIACKSVLCCRVNARQKANVVGIIKKHLSAITLSIGDGANDVRYYNNDAV